MKSALLLAALNAPGRSRIVQSELTRDHTEKMLAAFGAEIAVEAAGEGGEAIHVTGEVELKPCAVDVPRDPSSAAFRAGRGADRAGLGCAHPRTCCSIRAASG